MHLNQNLEATTFKNEVYISYKDDLAVALHYSREHSIDSEAAHLSRAANILRSDMIKQKQNFNSFITQHCQQESVPGLLLSFIHMPTGSSYDPASNKTNLSARIRALSFAQLIQFNTVGEQRTNTQFRHNADKETPRSIYVAFLLHFHICSRLLIEKFYDLGLCISYQRMFALSTLSTASDSWHGTTISAAQHLEHAHDGVQRPLLQLSETKTNSLRQLPITYRAINPYLLKSEDVLVPPRLMPSKDKVDSSF